MTPEEIAEEIIEDFLPQWSVSLGRRSILRERVKEIIQLERNRVQVLVEALELFAVHAGYDFSILAKQALAEFRGEK